MASNSELVMREASYEEIEEVIDNKWACHDLGEKTKVTITFDEAMKRELEYRNSVKMKMKLSQSSVASGSLHSPSQIQLLPNLSGLKRKAAFSSLPQPVFERCYLRQFPPQQVQDQQPSRQKSEFYLSPQLLLRTRPLLYQPSYQKPSAQLKTDRHPSSEGFGYQHHSPHKVMVQHSKLRQPCDPQVLPQPPINQPSSSTLINPLWCSLCKVPCMSAFNFKQHCQGKRHKAKWEASTSSTQIAPLWCNICEVPCMNALNLEQHFQGKKHKAKREEVFGNKKNNGMHGDRFLWCHECNVPCMNEMALAQHHVGKKHALRLLEFGAFKVDGDSVVAKNST